MKESSTENGTRCRYNLFRFPLAKDTDSSSALVTPATRDGQERSRRCQGIVVGPRPDPVSVLLRSAIQETSFPKLSSMMH